MVRPEPPTRPAGRRLAGSLRLRVLVLTLVCFAAVAVPAVAAFIWIVDTTTQRLSTLFAERQILYDRHRALGPLSREVALAETLSRSAAVREWAVDEDSVVKTSRGIAELEHFRKAFRDNSYFFAVAASGNYYYNDRAGSFEGHQLRYTLSPENPQDGWFYKTLGMGAGCRLNVDNDRALKVTKVWINCVIHASGKPVGILGTGIDLTSFIGEVVNSEQPGVESMYVDASGAIQASRDESRIDFRSLTKDAADRKTVFQMLDTTQDRAELGNMMSELLDGRRAVAASFLSIGGRQVLVGVGYLGELDWFNVTLMDVDTIVDRSLFAPLGALIGAIMLAAAILVTILFKRSVLDRIAGAEASLRRIEAGDFSAATHDGRNDEIGRLTSALNRMAASVRDNTAHLEQAVRERTEQLERIAFLDAMTGVPNRRGFADAFERAGAGAEHAASTGFLLMDVDLFKTINDTHGHQAGDEVIVEVARRIADVTGDKHICARWGGDEFVVLISDCTPDVMAAVGRALIDALRSRPVALSDGTAIRITTSVGAHVIAPGEMLSVVAGKADLALYAAKRAGRNRMVVYDETSHGRLGGRMKVA